MDQGRWRYGIKYGIFFSVKVDFSDVLQVNAKEKVETSAKPVLKAIRHPELVEGSVPYAFSQSGRTDPAT